MSPDRQAKPWIYAGMATGLLVAGLAAQGTRTTARGRVGMEGRIVRGEVIVEAAGKAIENADLHIDLEDVVPDARAVRLARLTFHHVRVGGKEPRPLRFALGEFLPDEDHQYQVRAHLDVDRDGKISRGDYRSTGQYGVMTAGNPNEVRIRVSRVEH